MLRSDQNTIVMIMAGGKGSRLAPLTVHRSKPSCPFGGRYRIIDFVLSNFVNSGFRRIYVLTQYMASSMIKHLNRNWQLSSFGEFIEVVPAQMRLGEFWYRGTADAVHQNINLLRDSDAEQVAVFGGDHVYKFAVDQMADAHREREAHLSVACVPVPTDEARSFGVLEVAADGRIVGFKEKVADPPQIPGRPGWSLASMGNYLFRMPVLLDALRADAADPRSSHDFGKDIIPRLVAEGARVFAYDFGRNRVPGDPAAAEPYWRDVGTIDAYFDANMDLRSRLPALNTYNRSWKLHTAQRDYPPARFVRSSPDGAPCVVLDSLVTEGSIVASAHLDEVMLGYDCFVHAGSVVENSVFLSGCDVGAGAKVRGVLADKNCRIAPGAVIGHDLARDAERFPFRSERGIVVLPKGTHVPVDGPIQFAHDIAELMIADPDTSAAMATFAGRYTRSAHTRHSYQSAGPRYEQFADAPGFDRHGALRDPDEGDAGPAA
jgi:glucose-1-phosphate adenylyltransferase